MDDSEEEEDMEEGDEDEDVLSFPLGFLISLIPVFSLSQSVCYPSLFMYCPLRQFPLFPMMRVLLLLFLIELTCPDGGTRWYARARAQ